MVAEAAARASFIYDSLPARVVFGAGSIGTLDAEAAALGFQRPLILSTPQQADDAARIARGLSQGFAGLYDKAVMHVPTELVDDALGFAKGIEADGLIAIGGGSTTGLAKAMALQTGIPILAVPTTFAGSEMTPIYGTTEGGEKRTGRSRKVVPRTVIYDPDLTSSLPTAACVTSGLNALAHAAEGLYAQDANPIHSLIAEEGIRAIVDGLADLDSRADVARAGLLYGAWLCGTVLGHVGMALHHKLCHVLGGSFDLPHAETHSIILPHALAYNAQAAPAAMVRIARALRCEDAALGVHLLARDHGAPTALRDIGMRSADLDRAAELACANPYWNPRAVQIGAVRSLLQDAFDGAPPRRWDPAG